MEDKAGMRIKEEVRRREIHLRHDAAALRGETKERLQVHVRFEVLRLHPACSGCATEFGGELHAVRLKVLDTKHRASETLALLVLALFANQIERDAIHAGAVGLVRGEVPIDEAVLRHREAFGVDLAILRIGDLHFDRQTGEIAHPVHAPHDRADVNFVAWAVNTALGEEKGIETLFFRSEHAFRVEAREVQTTIFALKRQKGQIAAQTGQNGHRLLFAFQLRNVFKVRMTVHGDRFGHKLAIFRQNEHTGTIYRPAVLNRLHKDIA